MKFKLIIFTLSAITCIFAQPTKRLTVAVNDFQGKGVEANTATIISDRLRSELINSGKFRVLERSQMNSILQEQGFQQSGVCDSTNCDVKMGQLLGVDRMIVGSVGALGDMYTVEARIIDVSTGEVSFSVSQDNDGRIEGLLKKSVPMASAKLIQALLPPPPIQVDTTQQQPQKASIDSKVTPPSKPLGALFWTRIGLGLGTAACGILAYLENKTINNKNEEITTANINYDNSTTQAQWDLYRTQAQSLNQEADDHAFKRNVSLVVGGILAAGFAVTFTF